jgi:lipopolysaccharide transport system ATP-binding protein
MSYACRVDGLGKRYRVSRTAPRGNFGYRTLQEELIRLVTAPWRRLRGTSSADSGEDFWALRDLHLEIQAGEVVGIIGPNGAGKSTLLKILSRVTKPTTGQVELRGRVGSLLEVGTGFHPELTGRENIYLNGAILGMSRWEILRKFDEIIAFAEVENFLDTPVKRYSSGMYVRLAFAVAAYLEPEILIVDEVLAVGDMAFQHKCLGRMRQVGRSGRTVLFVSHNMPAVESLCTRGILLESGRIAHDGAVPGLVAEYRRRVLAPLNGHGPSPFERDDPCRPNPIFRSATLLDEAHNPVNFLPVGGAFHLRIGLDAPEVIDNPRIGLGIDDTLGHRLLTCYTPLSTVAVPRLAGRCEVDCRIDEFPLAPGEYWLKLGVAAKGTALDAVERALFFSVVDGELFGQGRGFNRGLCVARTQWHFVLASASVAEEPRN